MRLSDDIAARRMLYRGGSASLPDIVVIDIPARYASPALSLGRYYPIIVETALEALELDHFLARERSAWIAPHLLDRRRSQLFCDHVTLCAYDVPDAHWPALLLCQWPPAFTAAVSPQSDIFARQAYTTELFADPDDREAAIAILVASLGGNGIMPRILGAPPAMRDHRA